MSALYGNDSKPPGQADVPAGEFAASYGTGQFAAAHDVDPNVTTPDHTRLPSRTASVGHILHLDDQAVEAIKRGDNTAWEKAYVTYGKGLMGFLVLRLGDRDDAAEALSETFLRAYEKIASLRGGADAFRAWLFRIARNVATDRLRVRGRVSLRAEPEDEPDTITALPDDRAIAAEDVVAVRQALASLPPEDREVVYLRICVGLSSDEVGRMMDKKPGAVRMQQLRALGAMAKKVSR